MEVDGLWRWRVCGSNGSVEVDVLKQMVCVGGPTWDRLLTDSGRTRDKRGTDSGHTRDRLGTDMKPGTDLGGGGFVEAEGLWK